MYPFPSPSSIAQYYLRPAPLPFSSTIPTASPATAPDANGEPQLLSSIAGSALSSIKLSACCAIAAGLAGLGTGNAALIAVGALTVGTTVCLVEAVCARHDYQLPSAIVQHGVRNDWHTLVGGLAGGMPATAGLSALASALAVTAVDRPLQLGTNGLACLATMVGVPAMLLAGRGMRAIAGEAAGPAGSLARLAVPMLAVSAVLGLPAALLQQASPEAAVRFVVGFAADMASAAVREALTQATLPAWRGPHAGRRSADSASATGQHAGWHPILERLSSRRGARTRRTMARTPIVTAHLLPRMPGNASASLANPGTSQLDTTDSQSDSQTDSANATQTSVLVDSADLTPNVTSSTPTPCAEPGRSWA